ncbi:hypothetical protein ACP4OV_017133 [Aristida adscensionis]
MPRPRAASGAAPVPGGFELHRAAPPRQRAASSAGQLQSVAEPRRVGAPLVKRAASSAAPVHRCVGVLNSDDLPRAPLDGSALSSCGYSAGERRPKGREEEECILSSTHAKC